MGAAEWEIYGAHVVWWHYIKFVLTITKFCKLASTFCLIAASTERFTMLFIFICLPSMT